MTIVEALNFLLAVAGLVLSAYALGKQNNRQKSGLSPPAFPPQSVKIQSSTHASKLYAISYNARKRAEPACISATVRKDSKLYAREQALCNFL